MLCHPAEFIFSTVRVKQVDMMLIYDFIFDRNVWSLMAHQPWRLLYHLMKDKCWKKTGLTFAKL